MLEIRAVSCTLILTLVMALASSNTLPSVQRAWAHSVIATGNGLTVTATGNSPNTGNVYVGNDGGTLSVISPNNKVIATINVGGDPRGIAVNPNTGNVYVASAAAVNPNTGDGTVSVISPNNKVIATILVGGFPGEIAVNPNTGNVYVVNRDDGTVSVISPSNKVIATKPGRGDFADDCSTDSYDCSTTGVK